MADMMSAAERFDRIYVVHMTSISPSPIPRMSAGSSLNSSSGRPRRVWRKGRWALRGINARDPERASRRLCFYPSV